MCLKALMPILKEVDSELIIVDTGSTDNTVEIARQYTDRVFFHQWNNDFAEARNATIEKSQGDWYFYIDADEILENPQSIIDFFNKETHKHYKALAIKIINLSKEDKSKIGSTFHSKRIVKKENDLKFTSKIHEYLPNKLPVFLSESILMHYGYIQTDSKFVDEKSQRNIEIIKEELKAEPDSVFLLYHLAQTYVFNYNYLEALEPIGMALEITKKHDTWPMHIYILALDIYIKNNLFLEVEKTADEVLSVSQEETSALISIYFYLAQAQGMLKKNEAAIENYQKCLELLKRYERNELSINLNATVADFGGENYIYSQISALYDSLLDCENSIEYTRKILVSTKEQKSIDERDYHLMAVSQMVKLNIKYKEYDSLIDFYKELYVAENKNQIVVIDRFENTLESLISHNKNQRDEVIERFGSLEIDTDYVFLNKIRKQNLKSQTLTDEDVERIRSYNFNDTIDIYSELIYYLMKDGFQLDSVLIKLEEKEINRYNEYMARTFNDFSEVVANYFKKYDDITDVYYAIFSKALKRVVLIKDEVDNEDYQDLFKRYVNEGVFYLENVYKEEILENENIYVLKNHEEAFFMYMRKALQYKKEDLSKYVQYLKKSLLVYDYMKKGIEMLLEELKNEERQSKQADEQAKDEFEEYKKLVKNNVMALIEDNKFAEAKHLIDEYLKIVPVDLEMLALKSEVQLRLM
jgi:hypothetical protein